jgi:N-acetylneuraminate synthase
MNGSYGKTSLGKDSLYFIADVGANHDGSIDRAFKLIELAKESGADAAKFQNFKAAKIVSDRGFQSLGGKSTHQAGWKKSVFEVYQDASVSDDWTPRLKEKCDEVGIDYFTSPYDFDSVDHADPYVDMFKIGSGDITWLDIIKYVGGKGKPVLLATGASSMNDVYRAMSALSEVNNDIVLMQCNTNYTTEPDKIKYVNLRALSTLAAAFPGYLLGLSDHTFGHATVCGAIPLGARVIEKHFTDDNDREGPDHKFAMNPKTWHQMVDVGNEVLLALGDGIKRIEPNEVDSRVVQQRCLRAKTSLKSGTVLLPEHVEALRPCPDDALRPYQLVDVVGQPISVDLEVGDHLCRDHFRPS